jgi:hypothetical protein
MQKSARSKGAKNTLTLCVFPHLCIHKIILSFYLLLEKPESILIITLDFIEIYQVNKIKQKIKFSNLNLA